MSHVVVRVKPNGTLSRPVGLSNLPGSRKGLKERGKIESELFRTISVNNKARCFYFRS